MVSVKGVCGRLDVADGSIGAEQHALGDLQPAESNDTAAIKATENDASDFCMDICFMSLVMNAKTQCL